jgi:secreted PhoX family phosphatase
MPRFELLPMFHRTKGKRSPVTCALKCGNACARGVCNTSDNGYFRDIASKAMSRRAMLGLSGAGALAVAVAACTPAEQTTAVSDPGTFGQNGMKLDFEPIAPVDAAVDAFVVPAGFTWVPILRWGDGLFPDSPAFDPAAQTPEAQARQFGYNNDYSAVQIDPDSDGNAAVLFANHEYVNPGIMFPPDMDQAVARAVARQAQGLSVVDLTRSGPEQPWQVNVDGEHNRRFLIETEYEFTGPAAGSSLLQTKDYPEGDRAQGTLGNCSGGLTPWGTLLSGEENFNTYFVSAAASEAEKRYGMLSEPTETGWEQDLERFDTRNEGYENEANRFGWIVEVDPWDPESTPVKHTAMGRFKHEGANVIVADDGHVVAYMGDDEKFDYLYKFVSKGTYQEGDREANKQLLTEGDLYVAQFAGTSDDEIDGSGALPEDGGFDGTGTWLPLVQEGKSQVSGFSVEEVLVNTRLAADAAGATKMDRCEDVEPSLTTGKVYVACTNNDERGVGGGAGPDEANPRTENRDGHVVELTEADGQTGTAFNWSLLLVCGDPAKNDSAYFSGFPADQVSPISCPDNVAFDSAGTLWISTDGAPSSIGYNDGLFKVTLEGEERGKVEQFLSVPVDAETCGPVIHDQDGSVFVSVQHPGEDGEYTAQRSAFPDYVDADGDGSFTLPRPAVVQVLRAEPSEQDARQRALVGDAEAGDSLRTGLATA